MKTVSTLCATSTVGIAACGFALARPCTDNDLNDQLTNISLHPNICISPVIREPACGGFPEGPGSTGTCATATSISSQQSHLFAPPPRRSSTSRRWLHRLSESFSSASSSSSTPSSPTSSTTQSRSTSSFSSRSRPYTSSSLVPFGSRSSSRPPTGNKLVKVKRANANSKTGGSPPSPSLLTPSHRQRPSTAGFHQSTAPAQSSSHLSPIHASRPSTSAPETFFSPRPTLTPEPVHSWRVFFSAKRQKLPKLSSSPSPSSPSSGGGHLKFQKKPFSGVRRIYPKQKGRQQQQQQQLMGPTLILAPTMCSLDRSDNDNESLFSGAESLFFDSRPASRMDDLVEMAAAATNRRPLSMPMPPTQLQASPKQHGRRRSLSSVNYLQSAPAAEEQEQEEQRGQEQEQQEQEQEQEQEQGNFGICDKGHGENGCDGICALDFGFERRHSESASPPYHCHTPEERRDQVSPVQSLSLFGLNTDTVSRDYSPDLDDHLESLSPVDPHHDIDLDLDLEEATDIAPIPTTYRQHRLSLISASERASTLVGSEDFNNFESDLDFQSDTVFDSMRTRASELTPVRADTIFDLPDDSSFFSQDLSPLEQPRYKRYVSGDFTPLKNNDMPTSSSRNGMAPHKSFDDDEDGWSSDWDLPSKNGDGDGDRDDLRIPPQGGLRPYSGLLSAAASLGLHSNNASSTSFGTAPEGFSIDGSSIRETNSILDWSESVPNTSTPQQSYAKRSKTIHAKESMLNSTRSGRRAPSYHLRSQSMPLVNAHGRVPLPSENWDDDFLDDEEESGFGMVIPRAIEENQASVIGHLGCVREFALLVEDLKQLREQAISAGVRFGTHKLTFDEADGIIALATLDDDEPLPPQPEPVRTPASKSSRRRSSILSPDDDVFGGNHLPSTPHSQHLRRSFGHSPTPSNISPLSRKTIDKNDPVEVAKGIMERMQHQHQRGHHVRGQSDDTIVTGKTKKVQFDTDMLRELVKHVGKLKRTLQGIVDDARDLLESPLDMHGGDDGYECRGSFEGFEEGWDFRAVVGVV